MSKTVGKRRAVPSPEVKRVRFRLPAQRGKHICIAGTFNNWEPAATPMTWNARDAAYTASVALLPGRYEYKYVIDGYWCIDPYCPEWVVNQYGTLNSVLTIPGTAATRQPKSRRVTP